jgi:hypothetical protein
MARDGSLEERMDELASLQESTPQLVSRPSFGADRSSCGHTVEPSLLSFSFLFEHLFKSFVAIDTG